MSRIGLLQAAFLPALLLAGLAWAIAVGVRGTVPLGLAGAAALRLAGGLLLWKDRATALAGLLRAAGWPAGAWAAAALLPAPWLALALGLAAAGLSIEMDRIGLPTERRLGALAPPLITAGLAGSCFFFGLPHPLPLLLAAGVLLIGIPLWVRRLVLLSRPPRHAVGMASFWRESAAPLMMAVLVVALVAWGVPRMGLDGMPRHSVELMALAVVSLAGLRILSRYANRHTAQEAPLSPARRHQQRIDPVPEAVYGEWDDALGAFLATAHKQPLQDLALRSPDPAIPTALAPALHYDPPAPPPLVPAAAAYLAVALRALAVAIGMAIVARRFWDISALATALAAAGLVVYVAHFRRYGTPWWVRTLWGWAGVALLAAGEAVLRGEAGYTWNGRFYSLFLGLPVILSLAQFRPGPAKPSVFATPEEGSDAGARAIIDVHRTAAVRRAILLGIAWVALLIVAVFMPLPRLGDLMLVLLAACEAGPLTIMTTAHWYRQTARRRDAAQRQHRLGLLRSAWPKLAPQRSP